jgi:MFS family permease
MQQSSIGGTTLANSAILARPNRIENINSYSAWVVCLISALFFFYEFIQMNMFNAISTELMRAFNIDSTGLGNLSATYFWGDVLFLFPAGMILDRFSTRKIILASLFVCIAGTIVFANAESLMLAKSCRFITGIGNAFCFIACIRLASRWFPPRRMALVIGLIVTIAMLGGVFAQTPLVYLDQALGWRHALMFNACLGLIIYVLIWWYVFDTPPNAKQLSNTTVDHNAWHKAKMALSNPQNWFCGLYTSLLNLGLMLLGALWGVMYLVQVHGLSHTKASIVTSMAFFGLIVGSPVLGWISDSMGKRKPTMIIGAALSIFSILAIMFISNMSMSLAMLLFFLMGFFTSAQVIAYPVVTESNPSAITSTATGLASFLIMAGPAIAQPLFGWLMDYKWHGVIQDGVRLYSNHEFLVAMSILPISFIIGLALSFFIRETYCQPVKDLT